MRDTTKLDYYDILHVSPSATDFEIKSQYRRLSKRYHPDMGGSQADMAAINEAYRTLSDTFQRSLYDAERRRALHVPPREPEQPIYTPPRQRPEPRQHAYTASQAQATPKRKRRWWAALSWSFAIAVIMIGILLQLPLAGAKGSSDTAQQTTTQPLSVNYPSDVSNDSSSSSSTLTSMPDNTNTSTPATDQSDSTQPTTNSTNDPCSDNSACQQTSSAQNCMTKAFGLYKHTICSSGSSNCTANTIGKHRYTLCR